MCSKENSRCSKLVWMFFDAYHTGVELEKIDQGRSSADLEDVWGVVREFLSLQKSKKRKKTTKNQENACKNQECNMFTHVLSLSFAVTHVTISLVALPHPASDCSETGVQTEKALKNRNRTFWSADSDPGVPLNFLVFSFVVLGFPFKNPKNSRP